MTIEHVLDPARRWQHFGGGGLVASAAAFAVRTLSAAAGAPDAVVTVSAVLSAVLFLIATIFLAFGSDGGDGIVGRRRPRFALLLLGVGQLAGVVPHEVVGSSEQYAVYSWASSMGVVILLFAAIVSLSAITGAGIAVGPSRRVAMWAVLVTVGGSIVAGLLDALLHPTSSAFGWLAAVLAAGSLAWVGVTYWRNPVVEVMQVPAASENLAE